MLPRTLWLSLAACASSPPPATCPAQPAQVAQPAHHTPAPARESDVADRTARACEITALILDDAVGKDQLLAYDILRDADLPLLIDNPRAKPDDPRTVKTVKSAMDQTMAKVYGSKFVWLVVTTLNSALVSSQPLSKELLADPMIAAGFIAHKHGVLVIDGAPYLAVAIPIPREKRGALVLARPLDGGMVQKLARSVRATVRVLGEGWSVSSNPRVSLDLPRAKTLAANRCHPVNTQAAHSLANAVVVVEEAL